MFVTRKAYESDKRVADALYQELRNKYWELERKYQLLLDYLEIKVVNMPAQQVILKKGETK